jgi:hypothetical protein
MTHRPEPAVVAKHAGNRTDRRLSPEQQDALVKVGRSLCATGYEFVTVTPETHRRVNERAPCMAGTLRDVFGWNRLFSRSFLPADLFRTLEHANLLSEVRGHLVSRVRFSSLGHRLFAHSPHPTASERAVFFGPDTYRFASSIQRLRHFAVRTLDLGGGTGVGGILAKERSDSVVIADLNPLALDFARVNIELAGTPDIELVLSDGLRDVDGEFDLILANPPFMRDASKRLYRSGGGEFGEEVSVRFVREGMQRLAPGGTLLVYTGVAITNGTDPFRRAIEPLLHTRQCRVEYKELDPDIFGDELESTDIVGLERIAAVSLVVTTSC